MEPVQTRLDPLPSRPNGTSVRILGIDPGLRVTGYGVIDWHGGSGGRGGTESSLIDGGVIRLNADTPIPGRLVELERELQSILTEHKPEVMAVEMLYSSYKSPRTAILMAHARGVILLCGKRASCRIEQIAPARVKQSMTGHGRTSKGGMQRAVQQYWKLAELPQPSDVADALAVALACGRAIQVS